MSAKMDRDCNSQLERALCLRLFLETKPKQEKLEQSCTEKSVTLKQSVDPFHRSWTISTLMNISLNSGFQLSTHALTVFVAFHVLLWTALFRNCKGLFAREGCNS